MLTRSCPICGEKMRIKEPRDFVRAIREHTRNAHPQYYAWTRRFRVLAIPILASFLAGAMVLVIFAQSIIGPAAPVVGLSALVGPLLFFGVFGRYQMKKSQRAWIAGHGVVASDSSSSLGIDDGVSPEPSLHSVSAQEIIGISRDLAQRLEISRFEPESVSWQDYFTGTGINRSNRPVMVPYDGCLIKGNQLVLPESTRDKLEPVEWTPLIASELVYQRKLRENRRVGLLVRILPLTLVYLAIPVVLWQLGILNLQGTTTERGAPIPVLVAFFQVYVGTAGIFAMVLYILLGLRFDRKMRLKADAIALGLTGKTIFLSALQKIGTSFPDIMSKGRPSVAYPPGRPSIQKRIENIQASAGF